MTILLTIAFVTGLAGLIGLGLAPSLHTWRRRIDSAPLPIDERSERELHHEAAAIASAPVGVAPGRARRGSRASARRVKLDGGPGQNGTVRVEGDLDISEDSALRAAFATGSLILGARGRVDGWLHAQESITIHEGCRVSGSVSAARDLTVAPDVRFERLSAETIKLGSDPQPLPVASLAGASACQPADLTGDCRWMAETRATDGDLVIDPGSVLRGDHVVNGSLQIGEGCLVHGSIHVNGDLDIGSGVRITGALFCSGSITVGKYSTISGPIVAERSAHIAGSVVMGTPSERTTFSAQTVEIATGVRIHGTVVATVSGWVVPDPVEASAPTSERATRSAGARKRQPATPREPAPLRKPKETVPGPQSGTGREETDQENKLKSPEAMTSRRILLSMGTRPEIIKMGPVYHALIEAGFEPVVLHTGQHTDMAWPVYDFFGMEPDHKIELTRDRPTLGHLGGRLMDGIDEVLTRTKPDAVLVHGDTSSALMGAQAAFFGRIPVGHVEAGLRSHDMLDPFPEEANRVQIARLARWHFAPTRQSAENLTRELVEPDRIFTVGNTIVDATQLAMQLATEYYADDHRAARCPVAPFVRSAWAGRLLLVTLHRRENWGEPIERVATAVRDLLEAHPDLYVVWPVHLNPIVRESVFGVMDQIDQEARHRLHLAEPLDYHQMIWALRHAWLTLTDSGGIQEEAAALRLPVLVARKTTERPELIEAGGGALVGTDPGRIRRWIERLGRDQSLHSRMRSVQNPFGDGTAGQSIANVLYRDLVEPEYISSLSAA